MFQRVKRLGLWSLNSDIVELLASPSFTTEILCYLQAKISDHRQLLLEVFPGTKLHPKHHYLEQYLVLIKKFGPLIEFWTIRFEAKYLFFKKVVHNTGNFKNNSAHFGHKTSTYVVIFGDAIYFQAKH